MPARALRDAFMQTHPAIHGLWAVAVTVVVRALCAEGQRAAAQVSEWLVFERHPAAAGPRQSRRCRVQRAEFLKACRRGGASVRGEAVASLHGQRGGSHFHADVRTVHGSHSVTVA
eukprot:3126857-Lingulodinium_polyedra.AAC.1